jgi:hypothetical protein
MVETLRVVHLITGLEAGGAERMLTRVAAGTDHDRFASLVVSMTCAHHVSFQEHVAS